MKFWKQYWLQITVPVFIFLKKCIINGIKGFFVVKISRDRGTLCDWLWRRHLVDRSSPHLARTHPASQLSIYRHQLPCPRRRVHIMVVLCLCAQTPLSKRRIRSFFVPRDKKKSWQWWLTARREFPVMDHNIYEKDTTGYFKPIFTLTYSRYAFSLSIIASEIIYTK